MHMHLHLQQVSVDLKEQAAPLSPPGAFRAGDVILRAPPASRLHRAVVPFGTAPAAGAGCSAGKDILRIQPGMPGFAVALWTVFCSSIISHTGMRLVAVTNILFNHSISER
jgi:hypothetical protein